MLSLTLQHKHLSHHKGYKEGFSSSYISSQNWENSIILTEQQFVPENWDEFFLKFPSRCLNLQPKF